MQLVTNQVKTQSNVMAVAQHGSTADVPGPAQQGGPGGPWPTQLSGQVVLFLPLYRDIEHQERSVDRHPHSYSCSGPSLVPRRLGTRLIIVARHPYHVVPTCPLKYGERAFSPWPKLRVSEEEIWYKRKVLPITVVR